MPLKTSVQEEWRSYYVRQPSENEKLKFWNPIQIFIYKNTLYLISFWINLWWSTLSKAYSKSVYCNDDLSSM